SGGAYALAEAPELGPPEEKAKPKEEPKAVRRTLKKRQMQFGVEWQDVRQPMLLFMIGLSIELLVWVLQLVILIMGMMATVSYSKHAEDILLLTDKDPGDFKEREYEPMYRVPFAISLVVGSGNLMFGRLLYIFIEVLRLVEGGLWLTAYSMCLRCPDVRGTRGQ